MENSDKSCISKHSLLNWSTCNNNQGSFYGVLTFDCLQKLWWDCLGVSPWAIIICSIWGFWAGLFFPHQKIGKKIEILTADWDRTNFTIYITEVVREVSDGFLGVMKMQGCQIPRHPLLLHSALKNGMWAQRTPKSLRSYMNKEFRFSWFDLLLCQPTLKLRSCFCELQCQLYIQIWWLHIISCI